MNVGTSTCTHVMILLKHNSKIICSVCRCDGVQQHVRIFQHGGKYGFTPPYTYSSLMELVLHYSEHSVSLQNSALYTTLKFPVLKDGS